MKKEMKMKMSLDNPSKSARLLMRSSVDESLRLQNEVFCNQLLRDIKSHPLFRNPSIDALKFGAFDKATLRVVHLDFRHGVVQIFTDAIVMAQFHTRQLEHRLGAKGKMASRFLLGLNLLDEFGFCPGYGEDNTERYRGNSLLSHPLLFDAMLEEFDVDDLVRDYFLKSEAAIEPHQYAKVRAVAMDYCTLWDCFWREQMLRLEYSPFSRQAS